MALTHWTQSPTTPSVEPGSPTDRATEFVSDSGGADTTSAPVLLVSAYVAMWALLLGFVWLGWRRQQKILTQVEQLERAIERADGNAAR